DGQVMQIVGVLADLSYEHPLAENVTGIAPTAFAASNSGIFSNVIALIETELGPAALRQALQGLVDSGAIERTIGEVTTLAARRNDFLAADRARSFVTIGTAALVVLLAAFGFYGTQRYLVAAGRREYAIRASLGAGPRALGRLVF